MYEIGLAALGMLGSLPVALAIDGYGPISDNAGGLAEMNGLPSTIRDKTDVLGVAGNTTAAIGKGFAIGAAALVGLPYSEPSSPESELVLMESIFSNQFKFVVT